MAHSSINVQKSIKLLDDATGTSFMGSPQNTSLLRNTSFWRHAQRLSFEHNYAYILDDGDAATTNVGLLLDEDPGFAACTCLFTEFEHALRANPSQHQLFTLLSKYEQLVHDQIVMLRKLTQRAAPDQKYARTQQVLNQLLKERATWRLVCSLYRDRAETAVMQQSGEEPMMLDSLGKRVSEKRLCDALMENNASIRQNQLIVDWLEQLAHDDLDLAADKLEYFTDRTGAWEHTLHSLRQQKKTERQVVDKLDPDAPQRQKLPLNDLDHEDEQRLIRHVFHCVRAGDVTEAQRLCKKCGQSWRAATLEGWRLYHDPNFESPGQSESRFMEKCMLENDCYGKYERATYAALTGNLAALLPVCESWQDRLWAHYKVLVDTQVEEALRLQSLNSHSLAALPPAFGKHGLTPEVIFKLIEGGPNEVGTNCDMTSSPLLIQGVRQEAKQRYHVIQKHAMLSDIDGLLEQMYDWTKSRDRPHSHMLRFMAHLVLFFHACGVTTKERHSSAIMESYVKVLIDEKRLDLVARYVSRLPRDHQVLWYARCLDGISEREEREMCLQLGVDAGIDMHAVTRLVVMNIRKRPAPNMDMETDTPQGVATAKEDREKIEAIDWLIFDPAQRAEALIQTNAIMRSFLGMRKLSACREAFQKIPPGSIELVITNWRQKAGDCEINADHDNAIREYLNIKAYLEAHESFNDWFSHYYNAKPVAPDIPQGELDFTLRVTVEERQRQYEDEIARWHRALGLQTKETSERLYNVLLFVGGGWMVDGRDDGTPDEQRAKEMSLLRKLCLPSTCFLLQKVLAETGQHEDCLKLADIIASEQRKLYTVFNRDELQRLLHKLHDSGVYLLEQGTDPLGYPLS